MDQSACDGDALAHAPGKGTNRRRTAIVEADFPEKFFGPSGRLGDILKFGEEDEVFFGGKLVVDHGGVGHVAGTAVGVGFGGGARERELPCRWANNAGRNAQESGFSRAIAAGKDQTFAGRNFEGDAAKSVEAAVALVNVVEPQTSWRQGQKGHDKAEIGKANIEERFLAPKTPLGMTVSLDVPRFAERPRRAGSPCIEGSAPDEVAKKLFDLGFFASVVFLGNGAGLTAKFEAENLVLE